jgi:peroxiredoxin
VPSSLAVKRIVIWLVVGVCLAGLYLYSKRRPPKAPPTASGNVAPEFTVTDLDGRKLSLSDYKGKVVLLDFWATWCTPCREEIPHFVEMQNKYGPQGFQVIGVSMDDDAKPVREYYEKYKLNYPVALGDDKLAERFGGVLGLPVNFVIDREGRIQAKHLGATNVATFDDEVSKLLAQP